MKNSTLNKGTVVVNGKADSILNQFKHYFNDTMPLPESYVSDYENIFTAEQEVYLNHVIDSFEKQTTNEIAVVSFDTAMVAHQNFIALTVQLANTWGVGKEDKQNGILIGICTGYKKIRIQNGRGIEKVLSDTETKLIVDSIFIHRFKDADYFGGTVDGIRGIIQKLMVN